MGVLGKMRIVRAAWFAGVAGISLQKIVGQQVAATIANLATMGTWDSGW